MATTNIYKVNYHFEQGKNKSSQDYSDYVSAAANDYNSIQSVLSSNSKLQAGKLVIDAVQNVGITGVLA
jgi:hypothetical protein